MRTVDWVRCDDRSTAKRVCDRLITIGARIGIRIINVTDALDGCVVWFECEGEINKDTLPKGDET